MTQRGNASSEYVFCICFVQRVMVAFFSGQVRSGRSLDEVVVGWGELRDAEGDSRRHLGLSAAATRGSGVVMSVHVLLLSLRGVRCRPRQRPPLTGPCNFFGLCSIYDLTGRAGNKFWLAHAGPQSTTSRTCGGRLRSSQLRRERTAPVQSHHDDATRV